MKAKADSPLRDLKVFGIKSRRFLAEVQVRSCYRLELNGYLRLLDNPTDEFRQVTETIEAQVKADPQATLLLTMPGIAAYSALLILSEIGDIKRFRTVGICAPMQGWFPQCMPLGERLGGTDHQAGLKVAALDSVIAVGSCYQRGTTVP